MPPHYRVAIIGAGISGLCAAIYMERAGIGPFTVLEKAGDLGGTWRDNCYPGVECDVPSHLYSYSFELKPDWSKEYAPGSEIHQYLRDVANKYGVYDRIAFDTKIDRAVFRDGIWHLTAHDGDTLTADFVVSGMGGLHTPKLPEIEGLDKFAGAMFHTARWDDTVALAGRRVAIIGTGATAVQCAPKVAEIAQALYVLQRSPVWVGPKDNPEIGSQEIERLRQDPAALRKKRWNLWKGWETTGLAMVTAGHPINQKAEFHARRHMSSQVEDPVILGALTPDYNYTCKRPTISNDYYRMFNQENVELVSGGIDRMDRDGILMRNGRRVDVDVIILATGFRSFDIRSEIDIIGAHGRGIDAIWKDRITTYRTIMAPDLPNFFFLLGPNTAGLTSTFQFIEAECEYIVRTILYVEQTGHHQLVPKLEEVHRFCDDVQANYAKTTQNKGCVSWWSDGAGYAHANWPRSSIDYRLMVNQFVPEHFEFS